MSKEKTGGLGQFIRINRDVPIEDMPQETAEALHRREVEIDANGDPPAHLVELCQECLIAAGRQRARLCQSARDFMGLLKIDPPADGFTWQWLARECYNAMLREPLPLFTGSGWADNAASAHARLYGYIAGEAGLSLSIIMHEVETLLSHFAAGCRLHGKAGLAEHVEKARDEARKAIASAKGDEKRTIAAMTRLQHEIEAAHVAATSQEQKANADDDRISAKSAADKIRRSGIAGIKKLDGKQVIRACKAGGIEHVRQGKAYMVRLADVIAYFIAHPPTPRQTEADHRASVRTHATTGEATRRETTKRQYAHDPREQSEE